MKSSQGDQFYDNRLSEHRVNSNQRDEQKFISLVLIKTQKPIIYQTVCFLKSNNKVHIVESIYITSAFILRITVEKLQDINQNIRLTVLCNTHQILF